MRWQPTGDEGTIEQVEPRRNLFFRQDEMRTKSFAANLDQVLILVAAEPVFSEIQLARALIAARSAGIDAHDRAEQERPGRAPPRARERLLPYRAWAYGVLPLSLKARPQAAREHAAAPLLAGRTHAGARAPAAPARAR